MYDIYSDIAGRLSENTDPQRTRPTEDTFSPVILFATDSRRRDTQSQVVGIRVLIVKGIAERVANGEENNNKNKK